MSEVKTNKISSLASNNDITLDPDGTGRVAVTGSATMTGTDTFNSNATGSGILLKDSGVTSRQLHVAAPGSVSEAVIGTPNSHNLTFATNNSERMRIASDGTVLVAKTSADFDTVGLEVASTGRGCFTRDGGAPLFINRKSSDGDMLFLRKNNSTIGKLGCDADAMFLGSYDTGLIFEGFQDQAISPYSPSAENIRDDAIDLGYGSSRFDDIFATNTSITTSDQNEKQQIAVLTSAEMTAAKAISALFKTYKWNKSVTNNGDSARIHTGVIAQEVQAAMSDAGLDASKYAFWCSNTWWEADETYTNDAGEEKTRTRQYHVEDEAPEGATKRTRLGVRYPELLAFVGAATEQRLADIETRLTALEA